MPSDLTAAKDIVRGFFTSLHAIPDSVAAPQRAFELRHAPRFDPLNILLDREPRWSAIIAQLLDPSGGHGQGRLFLDAFLRIVGFQPAILPDVAIMVRSEAALEHYGRADILVIARTDPPITIVIENKLWAPEGRSQLKRYNAWIGKQRGNGALIYLHAHNQGPSIKCLHLPYRATSSDDERSLIAWLDECGARCRAERVAIFLRMLRDRIEIETEQNMLIEPVDAALAALLRNNPHDLKMALRLPRVLEESKRVLTAEFFEKICEEFQRRRIEMNQAWHVSEKSLITELYTNGSSLKFTCDQEGMSPSVTLEYHDKHLAYGVSYQEPQDGSVPEPRLTGFLKDKLGHGSQGAADWWAWWLPVPAPLGSPKKDEAILAMAEALHEWQKGTRGETNLISVEVARLSEVADALAEGLPSLSTAP